MLVIDYELVVPCLFKKCKAKLIEHHHLSISCYPPHEALGPSPAKTENHGQQRWIKKRTGKIAIQTTDRLSPTMQTTNRFGHGTVSTRR